MTMKFGKFKTGILILIQGIVLPGICFSQDFDSLKIKAVNNQNPAKWNIELYDYDKNRQLIDEFKPMDWMAFPVEDYQTGVFSDPFNFHIQNSIFSGITFGKNLTTGYEGFKFDYYATLIFKTPDSIQIGADVISRNSPSVTLRGRLKLKDSYDFIGIKHPDDTGTLFVGVKAFDLRFGSTIIIFPNTNSSFSYLQLDDLPESVEDFDNYVERLRNNEKVRDMLNHSNNSFHSDKQ